MSEPFNGAQSWKEKVLDADRIWNQVDGVLKSNGLELPGTPRRPDVRMILENVSGTTQLFRNPGDHSSKAETIPESGDKKAAMVMVKGETLSEQFKNASALVKRYDLEQEGLSSKFVNALKSGEALDLVDEAYGPAPFESQADKLVEVEWKDSSGNTELISPVRSDYCAYGARAATDETAFLVEMAFFVKGTGTTAEQVEGGMVIAVSEDWQTKEQTTRPIVPSVAAEFYGDHFKRMPVVELDGNGFVTSIDLKNGTVINLVSEYKVQNAAPGLS